MYTLDTFIFLTRMYNVDTLKKNSLSPVSSLHSTEKSPGAKPQ